MMDNDRSGNNPEALDKNEGEILGVLERAQGSIDEFMFQELLQKFVNGELTKEEIEHAANSANFIVDIESSPAQATPKTSRTPSPALSTPTSSSLKSTQSSSFSSAPTPLYTDSEDSEEEQNLKHQIFYKLSRLSGEKQKLKTPDEIENIFSEVIDDFAALSNKSLSNDEDFFDLYELFRDVMKGYLAAFEQKKPTLFTESLKKLMAKLNEIAGKDVRYATNITPNSTESPVLATPSSGAIQKKPSNTFTLLKKASSRKLLLPPYTPHHPNPIGTLSFTGSNQRRVLKKRSNNVINSETEKDSRMDNDQASSTHALQHRVTEGRKASYVGTSRHIYFGNPQNPEKHVRIDNSTGLYHLSGLVEDLLTLIRFFTHHDPRKSKKMEEIENRFRNAQNENTEEVFKFFDFIDGDCCLLRKGEYVVNTGDKQRDAAISACYETFRMLTIIISQKDITTDKTSREKVVKEFKDLLNENKDHLARQNYRVKYFQGDCLRPEGPESDQPPGKFSTHTDGQGNQEHVRTTTGHKDRSCGQSTLRWGAVEGASAALSFLTYVGSAYATQTMPPEEAWIVRGVASALVFVVSNATLWFFTRHCCLTPVTEFEYLNQKDIEAGRVEEVVNEDDEEDSGYGIGEGDVSDIDDDDEGEGEEKDKLNQRVKLDPTDLGRGKAGRGDVTLTSSSEKNGMRTIPPTTRGGDGESQGGGLLTGNSGGHADLRDIALLDGEGKQKHPGRGINQSVNWGENYRKEDTALSNLSVHTSIYDTPIQRNKIKISPLRRQATVNKNIGRATGKSVGAADKSVRNLNEAAFDVINALHDAFVVPVNDNDNTPVTVTSVVGEIANTIKNDLVEAGVTPRKNNGGNAPTAYTPLLPKKS